MARTTETSAAVPAMTVYSEYQVLAIDKAGFESFASEPLAVGAAGVRQVYELATRATKSARPYPGATGQGFLEISTTVNKTVTMRVQVPAATPSTSATLTATAPSTRATNALSARCGAARSNWALPFFRSAAPTSGRTGASRTRFWCSSNKAPTRSP